VGRRFDQRASQRNRNILEKKGLQRYRTSEQDARVVQMSLTDKTYKQMAQLASQQQVLNEFGSCPR